ncbi:MAG: TonB-dependent receptor [Pseudomonadales bacterium]
MNRYHRRFYRTGIAVAVATAALSTSTPTLAQEEIQLEEVLVSARKITENLQDIPIAIDALSAIKIERLGIRTTADVIKQIPSMTLTKGIGSSDVRPDIRGITALSGRANVAILVDGVDQTTDALTGTGAGQMINMGLYDLERVEVVHGPQSALYGRNAFGGAINYVTKKPSEDFEGDLQLEGAEYDTYRAKIGLSGPISDTVLYRVSAVHAETGGQYNHPVTGGELGADETDAFSVALQFLPNDNLDILTRLDYSKQDSSEQPTALVPYNMCERTVGGQTTITDGGCDYSANQTGTNKTVPFFEGEVPDLDASNVHTSEEGVNGTSNELLNFNMQIDWALSDDYTIYSNTAITNAKGDDEYDLDFQETVGEMHANSLASRVFGWVDEVNEFNYRSDLSFERDVIFQDLRLQFDNGGSVRWLAGVEYYKEEFEQQNYQRANESINTNRGVGQSATGSVITDMWTPWVADYQDPAGNTPHMAAPIFSGGVHTVESALPANESRETEYWGIYGSVDWKISDSWELSLSARYQEEEVSAYADQLDTTYLVPIADEDKPEGYVHATNSIVPAGFGPYGPQPLGDCPPLGPPGPFTPVNVISPDSMFVVDPYNTTGHPSPLPGGPPTFTSGHLDYACGIAVSPYASTPSTFSASNSFEAFNPRVALTWFYSDDHMFYGSVAKGTKPGGFNFDSILSESNKTYGMEEIVSYELGWKGMYWDGRVLFNGAIFLNDNSDKQANNVQPGTPPVTYVDNIGDTESKGLELQNTVLITSNFKFDISYAYIKAEYKTFVSLDGQGNPRPDLAGSRLPRTPEHSGLAALQYDFPLSGNGNIYARLAARYTSDKLVDIDGDVKLPARTTFDAQLGYTSEKLEVIGYVDNLTNDKTPTSSVGFVDFQQDFQVLYVSRPADLRTAGVRLTYRF